MGDVAAANVAASVRAVWTDFAGVLTPPLEHTMAVFSSRIGISPTVLMKAVQKVTEDYGTADFMLPLDTPLITEERWLQEVAARLPDEDRPKLPVGTIADLWFDERPANQAWITELRQLRDRRLFVGVLSNMMPTWDPYWRRMIPVDELFDDVILSFQVGCRKPQRDIYELAAARAGVTPMECVFIDDTLVNCEGARDAGLTAIHFTETTDAIRQLESVLEARR